MLTLAINNTNDIFLDENGNIALHIELNAVQDACLGAARTLLAEMVFFINQGLPDFQTVWDGTPDLQQFEIALRQALLSVDNVKQILKIDLIINNNYLNYTALILTTYGQTKIDGNLSV